MGRDGEPLVGLKGKLPQEGGAVLGQGLERCRFSGQGEALSEPLQPCSQPCSEQEPGLRPPEVLPSSLFCAAASELQFLPAEQPARRGRSEEEQLPDAGWRGGSGSVPSLLWSGDSHPPARAPAAACCALSHPPQELSRVPNHHLQDRWLQAGMAGWSHWPRAGSPRAQ